MNTTYIVANAKTVYKRYFKTIEEAITAIKAAATVFPFDFAVIDLWDEDETIIIINDITN